METAPHQPKHVAPDGGEWLHVLGDDVRVLVSGAETGGTFAVVETNTPPGAGPPLHMHTREDETFVVLEGKVEFTVGDTSFVLEPGHFAYGPKGVPHRFQNVGDTPAKMIVTLTPAGFEEAFFRPTSEQVGKNPPDIALLKKLAADSGMTLFV